MSYLTKKNIADIYPLSPMQQGMLFHTLYAPDSSAYLEQFSCIIEGKLDLNAIETAWNHLVDHYPTFRTVFNWKTSNQPIQIVLKKRPISLDIHNFDDLDEEALKKKIDAFVHKDKKTPFDMAKGPLMRITVLKLADRKHYFLWSYHHILLDGWCLSLIMTDFFAVYTALTNDTPLPALNRPPYKSYISWLEKQDENNAKQFWQEYLKGFDTPTSLPWDRSRDSSLVFKEHEIILPEALTTRLETFAREQRTTVSSVIQGVWALQLSRYSGADDVVFGVTVSGRPPKLKGSEDIVGLFINTLPIRTTIDEKETFIRFLSTFKENTARVTQYDFSFLPDVKACSQVPVADNLFDSIIVFENFPLDLEGFMLGIDTKVTEIITRVTTTLDITIIGIPEKEMCLRFLYNSSKFDVKTIKRIMGHYATLIEQMLNNTDAPMQTLNMLGVQERKQVLEDFNQTANAFPKDSCPYQLFEAQAEKTPDNIAVAFEADSLTYKALNERGNRLAHYLRKKGVDKDAKIGLMVERSIDMIVGILGIHKAGGAYLPMDPEYPKTRLEYMLEDSESPLLVTQEKLLDRLSKYPENIVTLDRDWDKISLENEENPVPLAEPENLSHLIYTSGSTGLPKGVMIEHGSLTAFLTWATHEFAYEEYKEMIASTSMCFDLSLFEFFLPLIAGAKLIILRSSMDLDKFFETGSATMVNTVPSALRHLVSIADKPHRIKAINLAGEPLKLDLVQDAYKALDVDIIRNLYGPTEDTTYSTNFRIPKDFDSQPLIGKPIHNTKVFILDKNLNPVPFGIIGEIYLSGANLARGYWQAPEKTAERFIPNPFTPDECPYLYKTGDLGKWLDDGNIEFHGRVDYQVKIRGNRIELGEIETRLTELDEIKDVVVIDTDDKEGNKYLVSYYVSDNELAISDIRESLKSSLPEYMIPSRFIRMESLPLTPNGKVDRKALPAPEDLQPVSQTEYVAPRDDTEKTIAKIWQEILDIDQVGVNDNFFELGGHSLKATLVISQISKAMEIDLPIKTMFETPTIDGLSKTIMTSSRAKFKPIECLARQEHYDLSHSQQRLWFLDKLLADPTPYHMHGDVLLTGALNIDAVKTVFQMIVDRHESLRTTFPTIDDTPVQKIADHLVLELPVEDITGMKDKEEYLERIIKQEASTPFDLEKGPLVRVNLVRLGIEKHMLVLTMHHIISDGWSIGIVLREAATAYASIIQSESPELPPLNVQYRDYALWQNQLLADGALNEQEEYWLTKLKMPLPILDLPTDRPRPPVHTSDGAMHRFILDRELSAKLNALTRKQDATLFMTLLAAFGVFLNRLSQQEDIIIGSPIAGRNHPDLEGLIGFFINTLALRIDFSLNPVFTDLMQQVKSTCLEAYSHQDYPIDNLIDRLNPVRDTSRTPIFNVMFVMQNTSDTLGDARIGGIRFKDVTRDLGVAKFDLTLFAVEKSDQIEMHLEYNTNLFNRDTIKRYAGYFSNLLENLVENPQKQISGYELLEAGEKQRLLEEFNATDKAYPETKCIHELVEDQVDQHPDRVALTAGEEKITYQELEKRANQLAHYLRSKNMGPDIPVGVFLDRSIDMVVGVLGIIKAGGAYVPIDPEYPKSRIKYMLDDCDAALILSQSLMKEKMPEYSGEVLYLDTEWEKIEQMPGNRPGPINTSKDLVYIIYTSGSTGNPKGIEIEHRGLINYITWSVNYYDARGQGSFPLYTSMSFDLTVTSMFVPLVTGESIDIQPIGLDPTSLVKSVISNKRCDIAKLTPAHLEIANSLTSDGLEKPKRLNRFILGGESLSAVISRAMLEKHPELYIYNEYGPAETVVGCIVYKFNSLDPECVNVPIGKPIANTKIYILDKNHNLVPMGVPGEICISSPGVARGYLNKAEVTAKSFVPNPFVKGDRIYKTGDLGRWLPDGNIECLGRVDYQVKIRGHRIELEEIENILSRYERINDCVVVDKDDQMGDKYLVGYYTAGSQIPSDEIKAFLKDTLPEYMIPTHLMCLDALPLTPNGKVDRNALPEPKVKREDMSSEYVAPEDETEKSIALIWQEILGIDKVGVTDNFFELGGHSLKATKVISKIKKDLGLDIPLRAIFEVPTIQGLCRSLTAGEGLGDIEILPQSDAYALSHAQTRLWFLDRMIPASPAYNIPNAFIIDGNLNMDAIKKALAYVVSRHDVLRTTFHGGEDSLPYQVISNTLKVKIDIEDAAGRDETELTQIGMDEAMAPFDISKGPLLRTKIFRISEKSHLMLLVMHHIISDGWSMEVLIKELISSYMAFAGGITPELPALKVQYKDYSAWQNTIIKEERFKDQEDYWCNHLKGELPIIDLPADRPRPAIQTTNGATYRFTIDPELFSALKDLAKAQDVTLFMLLLGALDVLIFRMTGQEDVIVGSPIAGRNHPDLENLIGFFVNTLALRTGLSGNPSFTEVVKRVKETCINAYANQDYPFDKLIDKLNVTRNTSRTPFFNIMLAMQDISALTQLTRIGDFAVRPADGDIKTAKFDMTIFAQDAQTDLYMAVEYNTDLFNESTIIRFSEHLNRLLSQVVQDPESVISAFDIVGNKTRKIMLDEFNATTLEYPREATITTLFEARTKKSANLPALAFKETVLSFTELNTRANMLAHLLQTHGVKPGVLTGMMLGTPIESIVTILGILKAGGAYMPIDPDFPEQRIAYMLKDSQTPVVVIREQFLEKFPEDTNIICIDRDWKKISEYPSEDPETKTCADDTAYAIYTSGSTGKPKGTLVPHRGAVNLVFALEKEIYSRYSGSLRVAQVASFSFDASVQQIFASLLLGHTLYPIPGEMKRDMEELIPYILEHEIEVIDGTPSLWELLVGSGLSEKDNLKLKHIIVGGEALPVNLVERFQAETSGKAVKWTNVYGITESSVDSTAYLVDLDALQGMVNVPIGAPLSNTYIYILDKNMNILPIGVSGELYIGGDGLAKGYLNNPDRTRESFIPDPFKKGKQIYKTGDLGRWLPDGNIEFFGRIDFQVKIRGFRIEIGEIEHVFSSFMEIEECVVVGKKDRSNTTYLGAYYVSDEEIPVTELRAFLGKSLPDYMIPQRFMRLTSLPLNTSGKVNRNALPDMEGLRPEMSSEYVAPRNDMEEVLALVWQEVLGLDKVGIHDNFFDLGGDSIISLQVVGGLKKRGYEIRPRDMFEYQTISEIAPVVDTVKRVEAEQGPVVGEAPLTPIQKWFFDLGLSNNSHFNQALMFKSAIRLNEDALRKSLQALIDHHDALRLRFPNDTQAFQPLEEKVHLVVTAIENEQALNTEASRLQKSLDIINGPVFGAGLYHSKDGADYLVFVGHHLVVDGVTWRILLEDLLAGYTAAIGNTEIILPEKTTSYKEWAHKLYTYAQSIDARQETTYWEQTLSDEIPELPIDHDLGDNNVASSEVCSSEVSAEMTDSLLKEANKAYSTEVNDLLLTALTRALSSWTGEETVIFDLERHGREDLIEDVDISRTIGWFTSIFPVVLKSPDNHGLAEHIKYVKESLRAIPSKGFNYSILNYLNDVNLPVNTGISFNYLGQVTFEDLGDAFQLVNPDVPGTIDTENIRAGLLDIVCVVVEGRLKIEIMYSQNRYKAQTIDNLAKGFKQELTQVITHCLDPDNFDITPSDFDLAQIDQNELDGIYD